MSVTGALNGLVNTEEWVKDALCAQTDPEQFFPDVGANTRDARQVCAECPVRKACLQYALNRQEQHGIWGGLSARDRRRLKLILQERTHCQRGHELAVVGLTAGNGCKACKSMWDRKRSQRGAA